MDDIKNENDYRVEHFGLRPRTGDGLYEATYRGYLKAHPDHQVFVKWGEDRQLFRLNEHVPVQTYMEARNAAALFECADIAARWNKAIPAKVAGPGQFAEDLERLLPWLKDPSTFDGAPTTFSHHGRHIGKYAIGGLVQTPCFCPIGAWRIRFTSYPLKRLPELPFWYKARPPETYVEALHKIVLGAFEGSEIVDHWNGGQSFVLKIPGMDPNLFRSFNEVPFAGRRERKWPVPPPPVKQYYESE